MLQFDKAWKIARQAAAAARAGNPTDSFGTALHEMLTSDDGVAGLEYGIESHRKDDLHAAQFLLKVARGTFSRMPLDDELDQLLFALPLAVAHIEEMPEPRAAWARLAGELHAYLCEALSLAHDELHVLHTPRQTSVLAAHPLSSAGDYGLALHVPRAEELVPGSVSGAGPALWLACVRVSPERVEALRLQLSRPLAREPRFLSFKARLEALAEESGIELELMPPAPWEMAFSISRMLWLRCQLRQLHKAGHLPAGSVLQAARQGTTVSVTPSHAPTAGFQVEMPDELSAEILQVLERAGATYRIVVQWQRRAAGTRGKFA